MILRLLRKTITVHKLPVRILKKKMESPRISYPCVSFESFDQESLYAVTRRVVLGETFYLKRDIWKFLLCLKFPFVYAVTVLKFCWCQIFAIQQTLKQFVPVLINVDVSRLNPPSFARINTSASCFEVRRLMELTQVMS